jgi:hypothetical protein
MKIMISTAIILLLTINIVCAGQADVLKVKVEYKGENG